MIKQKHNSADAEAMFFKLAAILGQQKEEVTYFEYANAAGWIICCDIMHTSRKDQMSSRTEGS